MVTRTVFPLFSSPSYQFSSFSVSPILQTSFSMVSDFLFLELPGLSCRTVLGGFYRSILLGVVLCVPFPSLVRISSSSPVYLFLLWISWVPSGHCLSLLSHFFGWNFSSFIIRSTSPTFSQSCVLPLSPVILPICA